MKRIIAGNSLISIGYRGENETRQIVFDISEWIKLYGKGNVALIHKRCGDESPYPCVVKVVENEAIWTITDSDVDKPGVGECELMYLIGGRIAKSDIWQTYTHKSLSDASSEVPEPEQSWVDMVIQACAGAGGGGEVVSDEQIREAVYKYMQENPVYVEETDPTIYPWAKNPKKPSYNAAEVGAYSKDETDLKIKEVNSQISSLTTKNQTLETTVEGLQQQLAEEAHFRGYLSTNAKIQALEATPNDFAYSAESGTKWIYDVTDGWRDTGTPVPDQLTPASETVPLMNGAASLGSEESYARGDHVHPTDTTRVGVEEFNELKLDVEQVLIELHNYAQALIAGGVN